VPRTLNRTQMPNELNLLPLLITNKHSQKNIMSSTTFSWGSQHSSISPESHPSASGNSGPQSPTQSSPRFSGDHGAENVVDAKIEDSLWFHDGNIILQAGFSLFKLHTSILGTRSAVLDGFLNWGQVSESSAANFSEGCVFEGYTVVKLADDGQDARYFFLSIYDSGSVLTPLDILS